MKTLTLGIHCCHRAYLSAPIVIIALFALAFAHAGGFAADRVTDDCELGITPNEDFAITVTGYFELDPCDDCTIQNNVWHSDPSATDSDDGGCAAVAGDGSMRLDRFILDIAYMTPIQFSAVYWRSRKDGKGVFNDWDLIAGEGHTQKYPAAASRKGRFANLRGSTIYDLSETPALPVGSFPGYPYILENRMSFSPDELLFAGVSDNAETHTLFVMTLPAGDLERDPINTYTTVLASDQNRALAMGGNDGEILAFGSPDRIDVYTSATLATAGKAAYSIPEISLQGGEGVVSDDCQLIASSYSDRVEVLLFDRNMRSLVSLHSIPVSYGENHSMAFNRSGTRLYVYNSVHHTLLVSKLPPRDMRVGWVVD